jgi:DNA-binding response OmpR family regulator
MDFILLNWFTEQIAIRDRTLLLKLASAAEADADSTVGDEAKEQILRAVAERLRIRHTDPAQCKHQEMTTNIKARKIAECRREVRLFAKMMERVRAAEARAERLASASRTLVEAWEDGAFMSDRTMRPHIRRLRDALAEASDV